jgi:class 3 adenylate cyclase
MHLHIRQAVFPLVVGLTLVPLVSLANVATDEHSGSMRGAGGAMEHPVASPPFYQERTFLVLAGFATAVASFVGFRVARRRRSRKVGPVAYINEAALVVDLVNSTYFATHYGNSLAMRARRLLQDRTLEAAEARGMTFVENTGDGYFMTFPLVGAAVHTAIDLLRGLRDRPPDFSPGPPLAVRAGISYGEILLDARGARHGAAINKAFRLEGVTREKFTRVEGETKLPEIPASDRIFLDEEAAQELRASEIRLRSVGFCKLKGFSGLHQVFEVIWNDDAQLLTRLQ